MVLPDVRTSISPTLVSISMRPLGGSNEDIVQSKQNGARRTIGEACQEKLVLLSLLLLISFFFRSQLLTILF